VREQEDRGRAGKRGRKLTGETARELEGEGKTKEIDSAGWSRLRKHAIGTRGLRLEMERTELSDPTWHSRAEKGNLRRRRRTLTEEKEKQGSRDSKPEEGGESLITKQAPKGRSQGKKGRQMNKRRGDQEGRN